MVISEAWDDGWVARINGARTPLVRADHALRTLRVPAGDSMVRLSYHPVSLRVGAGITAFALALAVWLSFQFDSEL